MMKALAKAGFNQSYTYFTWRNSKRELIEYFTELTQTDMSEYFRPNLWTNTPDILPFVLQEGGRPAFMIRVALAATLSPLYGIYSGYELCENEPLPGREEYLDSEKYQFKERDWNAPGNIKDWIARLNKIRKENRALQFYTNLRFHDADNDAILFYSKMTAARDNIILVVVNLDPHRKQNSFVYVPIESFGQMESDVLSSRGLVERRDIHLARPSKLRGTRSRHSTGACLPGAPLIILGIPQLAGDRLSARFRAPGDRALTMVPSNLARRSVFDLSVAHLHRLIALHIITKFPA